MSNQYDPEKRTKAIIEVEGNDKETIVTVTFDPPPVDNKSMVPMSASIASGMINAFNAKCAIASGGVVIDKLLIPQLNKEYSFKEIQLSALAELSSIIKDVIKNQYESKLNQQPEEIENGNETIPAAKKLH